MSTNALRTNLAVEGDGVLAAFYGNAESDNFEQLAKFVADIESAAASGNAKRVVADLRELEFATSSCLKVFAGWLIGVEERNAPYTVEFLANPQHSWQRRSLQALAACAPAVVKVKSA